MKCLIIDKVAPLIAQELSAWMQVDTLDRPSKSELIGVIGDYDSLIMRVDPVIDEEVFSAATKLKYIGVCSVGLDHVDLIAAKAHGVVVQNAPGLNANGVAELTLCKMLELSRKTITANNDIKQKHEWNKYKFMGQELYGKTVGILGFGRIGQRVAHLAKAFGMKVLAYDPYLPTYVFEQQGAKAMDVYEVLHNADYVTIHVPLTDDTKNLVNKKQIRRMKDGAFVLNMSRGGICNEKDIYDGLKSGKLGGYAADVMACELEGETDTVDSPLFECENFIVSPHAGAQTYDAMNAIGRFIVDRCKETFELE